MEYPLKSLKWLLLSVVFLGICCLNSSAQSDTGGAGSEASGTDGTDVSGGPQPGIPSPDVIPAGQPAASQNTGAAQHNDKSSTDKSSNQSGTSKDRLFFALPNFLTLENAGQVPPLTAAQKFKVTIRSSFDPVEYFWYGALAGISQAENSEAGYGQGGTGYGKRYGAYFADGTIENLTTSAVFPSLLHQDPRYFQMGTGGVWHRMGYAVSRIFVTRTDSGHSQINYSELIGSATAAGISTFTYHPVGERHLSNALSVWGSEVGYDTLTYVIKEFWPDIRRKLRRSKAN
jgi:hypothetical protein